jgi:hypothetical protein
VDKALIARHPFFGWDRRWRGCIGGMMVDVGERERMFIKKETGAAAAAPGDISESERRLHQRRATFKGAKVVFNNRNSVINCVVRDLSQTGAKLIFPNPQTLPPRFQLEIKDLCTYECELVRSKGVEYGVRFILTA